MKRLHVHVAVDDLAHSISFYNALFAMEPTVTKSDYAKWMLDDPRVNFAISKRGANAGLQHLGIQVETAEELGEFYERLRHAGRPVIEEGETVCCYATSEKSWITDPQGLWWETFLTSGESTVYGGDAPLDVAAETTACCAPKTPQGACCAPKPDLPAAAPCRAKTEEQDHDR
jgi:catechol 2,3-dioxygenase-like lactoylglutathione lyase family enzyme